MRLVTFVVFSSVPEVISRPEPGRGLVPQFLGDPKISCNTHKSETGI